MTLLHCRPKFLENLRNLRWLKKFLSENSYLFTYTKVQCSKINKQTIFENSIYTIHKYYRILSSLVHNITLFLHVPPIWWLYIYSLYISNNNKSIYTSCALCCLHMTIPYDDCHLWQWWHIFESPDWISNKVCCNFYETCTKKIHTIKCLSKSAHIEVIFEHLLSFIGTFDLNLMYT